MSEAARKDSDVELLVELDRRIRDLERTSLNTSKSAQRWHVVGDVNDPLAPPFVAPWESGIGGITTDLQFYKDGTGMVHMRGTARQSAAGGNQVCVMPEGFRPVSLVEIMIAVGSQSVVTVDQRPTINVTQGGFLTVQAPPAGGGAKWDLVHFYNLHFYAG